MSPSLSLDCNPCPDRHDIRHHTPLEPQHTLHFALSAMALPKGMTPSEMRALVEPNLAHLPVITFDDVARQVDLLNHQIVYKNEFIGQAGKLYHHILRCVVSFYLALAFWPLTTTVTGIVRPMLPLLDTHTAAAKSATATETQQASRVQKTPASQIKPLPTTLIQEASSKP